MPFIPRKLICGLCTIKCTGPSFLAWRLKGIAHQAVVHPSGPGHLTARKDKVYTSSTVTADSLLSELPSPLPSSQSVQWNETNTMSCPTQWGPHFLLTIFLLSTSRRVPERIRNAKWLIWFRHHHCAAWMSLAASDQIWTVPVPAVAGSSRATCNWRLCLLGSRMVHSNRVLCASPSSMNVNYTFLTIE